MTGRRPRVKECSACGVGITAQAKTGMCKSCGNRRRNSDLGFRRKVSEGQKRRMQEPEFAQMKRRIALRNSQKAMLDPAKREAARQLAIEHLQKAFTPEAIELRKKHKREAHAMGRDKRMEWCPPEFRALHHRNVQSKRMPAADSRKIIEKMIADREAARSPALNEALFWLNRISPITHQEDGTYRFGYAVLTPSEVISRAKLKGWEPSRWAA